MKIEYDFREFHKFADNLRDTSRLTQPMSVATKEIAKELLLRMKKFTPRDTGRLIAGWEGNAFAVTKKANGFEVLIVNKDPKATWVNDGHRAFNQYGGPYIIKHRVKVPSPYQWQTGDSAYYVYGHFFVERGIVELNNTDEVERLLMKELQKWWRGCLNG
jgi:hypothetical protein